MRSNKEHFNWFANKNNLISIITLPVNITLENVRLKCISALLKMWDIVNKTDSLGKILWPYFCVNKEAQKKMSTWDKFVKISLKWLTTRTHHMFNGTHVKSIPIPWQSFLANLSHFQIVVRWKFPLEELRKKQSLIEISNAGAHFKRMPFPLH